MSKYQNGNFAIIPKSITKKNLSLEALGLYLHLKILENNFNADEGFYHTDQQLAEETKKSDRTIRELRRELINADVIKWSRKHFTKDDKTSYQRIGYFEFINEENKKNIPSNNKNKDVPKKNAPNFTEREYNRDNLERELFARSQIP